MVPVNLLHFSSIMRPLDAYDVLGVEATAEPDEIRAAFRRLVQRQHPDTAGPDASDVSVREVIEAYRLLSDPVRRARYDADRARSGPSGARSIPVRNLDDRGPRRFEQARPRGSSDGGSSSGSTRCPTCGGSGAVIRRAGCPDCASTGEVTMLGAWGARRLRCAGCGGGGVRQSRHACGTCGGAGTAPA